MSRLTRHTPRQRSAARPCANKRDRIAWPRKVHCKRAVLRLAQESQPDHLGDAAASRIDARHRFIQRERDHARIVHRRLHAARVTPLRQVMA